MDRPFLLGLLCLGLASLVVAAPFDQRPFEVPGNRTVLTMAPAPANPRNSEGAFATLRNGRIIFIYTAYYGGRGEDHGPARLAQIHSDDQGLSWSAPRTVVENEGRYNVMSVSLLRAASGKLHLTYLVKNDWLDCRPYLRTSDDDGLTWSAPRLILPAPGYFVVNNDRLIQTAKGRLLLPLAFHRSRGQDPLSSRSFDSRATAHWIYSDDDGQKWQEAATWWAMPIRSGSGLQEPGVVERADGTLFSWARTDGGFQYGLASTDGGKNWSAPTPTTLASPVSPASIKRIPGSDELLAIYNDHSGRFPFPKGRRSPLVAAISKDGGATWGRPKLLEGDPDGWYCYTAIHFVGDDVLFGYCAGDGAQKTYLNVLRIRKTSLAWLRAE
ncbi:MAG: exo-alpha-sialidase [Verrucomicrobia bacterium]|nr:exo-alpha-sialidase [Verrucomicrobiota bacterium]